jgi:hypothetical protein
LLALDSAVIRDPDYIPEKTGERVKSWQQEKKPDATSAVCLALIIMR